MDGRRHHPADCRDAGGTGATGNVHFSMKALMKNKDGIADKLKKGPYAEPALVPETPWLGHETPEKPEVSAKRT